MGVSQVWPPSLLSLMHVSVKTNTCAGLFTFSAWAHTSCQVSLTTLNLLAPGEEHQTLPSIWRNTQPGVRRTIKSLTPRSFTSPVNDLASIGCHCGAASSATTIGVRMPASVSSATTIKTLRAFMVNTLSCEVIFTETQHACSLASRASLLFTLRPVVECVAVRGPSGKEFVQVRDARWQIPVECEIGPDQSAARAARINRRLLQSQRQLRARLDPECDCLLAFHVAVFDRRTASQVAPLLRHVLLLLKLFEAAKQGLVALWRKVE